MEYVVVVVYTTAGARIPLQDDPSDGEDLLSQKDYVRPRRTAQFDNNLAGYPPQAYAAPTWTGHTQA